MEKLVITIHPRESDEGLLRVTDAMEQVIDLLRLHDAARSGVAMPEELFEWRLEEASTNSPLKIRAVARPRDERLDVSEYVRTVTQEMKSGLRRLATRREPAFWMDPEALAIAASIFHRNENGVGLTEFALEVDTEPLRIDRETATAGVEAVAAIDPLRVEATAEESVAWGEIRGVMVAAGRQWKRPSLRVHTKDYGYVWCRLSDEVAARYGHEKTLDETWQGRTIAIEGKFIYKAGGKLSRIVAIDVRDVPEIPRVDIDTIVDHDFTAGLDPVEYLRRLHEGTLA